MLYDWYGSVRVATNSTERDPWPTCCKQSWVARPRRSVTWILARLWQFFVRLSNIVVHRVHYVKSRCYCFCSIVRSFIVLFCSLFSLLLFVLVTAIIILEMNSTIWISFEAVGYPYCKSLPWMENFFQWSIFQIRKI